MADPEPLRDFIRRQFLFDEGAQLGDDDPLFPDVIDSLGVMEVVDFVEERYGVSIGEDDLLADNFRSLAAITALVDRSSDGG
jgi:acyl carrier protein